MDPELENAEGYPGRVGRFVMSRCSSGWGEGRALGEGWRVGRFVMSSSSGWGEGRALGEGWRLFVERGGARVEIVRVPGVHMHPHGFRDEKGWLHAFASDKDAELFVHVQAASGSEYHQLALRILQEEVLR